MPRGLNRTVIMSHGRNHDALGVKGTHLAGTVPSPAVLAAIPDAIGAVGNLPESALAGAGPSTRQVPAAQAVAVGSAKFDGEGDRVLPGGSRDNNGGPSTQRPAVLTNVQETPPRAPPQPRGGAIPPPPAPAPAPSQDAVSMAVADLKLTKRKLARASVVELTEWCRVAGINPKEYVESDDEVVSGGLMRRLLSEKFDIE